MSFKLDRFKSQESVDDKNGLLKGLEGVKGALKKFLNRPLLKDINLQKVINEKEEDELLKEDEILKNL